MKKLKPSQVRKETHTSVKWIDEPVTGETFLHLEVDHNGNVAQIKMDYYDAYLLAKQLMTHFHMR